MKPRQRTEEIIVRELAVREDEVYVSEKVVAAYTNGFVADALFSNAREEDGELIVPERSGAMILSGLRQAVALAPVRIPEFELTEAERFQAAQMIEEHDSVSNT